MLIRNLGARYMPVPSALARPGRARAQTSARTAKQRFIRFSPFFGKLAAAVRGSRQHSGCSSLARRSDIFKNNYSMPYFITYEIYLFFIACFFQDTLPPQEQTPSPQWLILHDMSSFPGKGLLCFFITRTQITASMALVSPPGGIPAPFRPGCPIILFYYY